jgi:hypothetical protein
MVRVAEQGWRNQERKECRARWKQQENRLHLDDHGGTDSFLEPSTDGKASSIHREKHNLM